MLRFINCDAAAMLVRAGIRVSIFSGLLVCSAYAGAAGTAAPFPPPGQLVDAGGYRVHLYCVGTGTPTVMVVGGAFSFDWALIQPQVARFTRICTYDPSGTAWSDPYPSANAHQPNVAPSCAQRVAEIHHVLANAGVPGPYVLVGFSIGGLVGRLYALTYPQEVAGMVIVDHAFIDVGPDALPQSPVTSNAPHPAAPPPQTAAGTADSPPVLISAAPIALGLEDDQNFSRLPERDRDLHRWAMSNNPVRPSGDTAAECFAAVERATGNRPFPFGDRPLTVVRTNNDSAGYDRLQAQLLTLSHNSRQIIAAHSSHMVIIDQPELVTNAIGQVVDAVRNGSKPQ